MSRAGAVGLMDLDGEDVGARRRSSAGTDGASTNVDSSAPPMAARGERRVADRAGRHVAAEDLGAVQVDDRAVVAQEAQRQRC